MPKLSLHARFEHPIERVWARIDDHARMSDWMPAQIRVTKGDGGVGTVRTVRVGLSSFDETVLEREAPTRLVYSITRGAPVKHRGEMRLRASNGGTDLDWDIELTSPIPFFANVVIAALRPALSGGLRKLATIL